MWTTAVAMAEEWKGWASQAETCRSRWGWGGLRRNPLSSALPSPRAENVGRAHGAQSDSGGAPHAPSPTIEVSCSRRTPRSPRSSSAAPARCPPRRARGRARRDREGRDDDRPRALRGGHRAGAADDERGDRGVRLEQETSLVGLWAWGAPPESDCAPCARPTFSARGEGNAD